MKASSLLALVWSSVVIWGFDPCSCGAAEFDAAKMVGTWTLVSSEKGGEKASQDRLQFKVVITKETLAMKGNDAEFVMKYTLDTEKSPVSIALTITESPFGSGASANGIIELAEDQLKICYDDENGACAEGIRHQIRKLPPPADPQTRAGKEGIAAWISARVDATHGLKKSTAGRPEMCVPSATGWAGVHLRNSLVQALRSVMLQTDTTCR